MPKDKGYNGTRLGVLGKGMAREAGEKVKKRKKTRQKRLDDIMGQIRSGR